MDISSNHKPRAMGRDINSNHKLSLRDMEKGIISNRKCNPQHNLLLLRQEEG